MLLSQTDCTDSLLHHVHLYIVEGAILLLSWFASIILYYSVGCRLLLPTRRLCIKSTATGECLY